MSKYITTFNQAGECIVDVDLICKKWHHGLSISLWRKEDSNEYTFIASNKKRSRWFVKVRISESQARQIIDRLSLIEVKSRLFNSASEFCTKSYIEDKLKELELKHEEKLSELRLIKAFIQKYDSAIS